MAFGLYIHIPYCKSKCRYCDFYSRPASAGVPDAYVEALLRDYGRYAPAGEAGPVTVYFGGGTPSLLSPDQVAHILAAVKPAPGAEISLEANPESAGRERFAAYRRAGVNRLSIGVQSARAESLARLGRLHTAPQAAAALEAARQAGFENLSGDIMLALPGYSYGEFDETLALLLAGGVTHVSAYILKLEPGTPLGDSPPADLPDEDAVPEFYFYAARRLEEAGFARYEISNFARPGFEGRHNLLYWNCENYLGLGPSAHSSLAGKRLSFGADAEAYIRDRAALTVEGSVTADDYIMLRLRLAAGLSEQALKARFGRGLSGRQKALLQGLAAHQMAHFSQGAWVLTPKGLMVQNAILAELLEFSEDET